MERSTRIRRVLIMTLAANIVVASAKVGVGILSTSLAMIADGIHSMLDAAANIIALIGTAIAAAPPDSDHPYGHRRFETLASLVIGGILLLTAWEVVQSAIQRLSNPVEATANTLSFAVMIVSLIVNLIVSTYERRQGEALNSELLLADSEHTRSDVLVSLTVIASLIAARLGFAWVDAVTALLIVGLIGWAAWRITRRSAAILVDRAALDAGAVGRVVEQVPGVEEVARVRSRGPQDAIHVDVDVSVAAPMTAGHSAEVEREIGSQLRSRFDGVSEVQVRFMPRHEMVPSYSLLARAEADALGLGVHEVIAVEGREGLSLKMHVEVDPTLTVRAAHDVVSEFEARLHARVEEVQQVLTHIEPAPAIEAPRLAQSAEELARRAAHTARTECPVGDWHEVQIYAEVDGGYAITMHCHLPGDLSIMEAHHMAEAVETRIRADLPEIHRVTIHTEPPEAG